MDEQAPYAQSLDDLPQAAIPEAGPEEAAAAAEPVAEAEADAAAASLPAVRPSDLCQRFGLSPYVLRGLLDEYGEWLPQVEDGLPPGSVERLGDIVRWRAEGLSPDAIRARLEQGQKADEPFAALIGRMAELHAALSRSEEHRVQDRDRLMMALIRTQQEIQQLRHEVSERPSRRERHRSMWRRLFDR